MDILGIFSPLAISMQLTVNTSLKRFQIEIQCLYAPTGGGGSKNLVRYSVTNTVIRGYKSESPLAPLTFCEIDKHTTNICRRLRWPYECFTTSPVWRSVSAASLKVADGLLEASKRVVRRSAWPENSGGVQSHEGLAVISITLIPMTSEAWNTKSRENLTQRDLPIIVLIHEQCDLRVGDLSYIWSEWYYMAFVLS